MEYIYLDGREMTTRETAHTYLQKQIDRVEYHGKNLDALYEVLSTWNEPTTILFAHSEEVPFHLGRYGEALLNTFQDATRENRSLTLKISKD